LQQVVAGRLDLVAELIQREGRAVAGALEHEGRHHAVGLGAVGEGALELARVEDPGRAAQRQPEEQPGVARPAPVDEHRPRRHVAHVPAAQRVLIRHDLKGAEVAQAARRYGIGRAAGAQHCHDRLEARIVVEGVVAAGALELHGEPAPRASPLCEQASRDASVRQQLPGGAHSHLPLLRREPQRLHARGEREQPRKPARQRFASES
jgi:hypothetical protein